jgi:hypothetical protein
MDVVYLIVAMAWWAAVMVLAAGCAALAKAPR